MYTHFMQRGTIKGLLKETLGLTSPITVVDFAHDQKPIPQRKVIERMWRTGVDYVYVPIPYSPRNSGVTPVHNQGIIHAARIYTPDGGVIGVFENIRNKSVQGFLERVLSGKIRTYPREQGNGVLDLLTERTLAELCGVGGNVLLPTPFEEGGFLWDKSQRKPFEGESLSNRVTYLEQMYHVKLGLDTDNEATAGQVLQTARMYGLLVVGASRFHDLKKMGYAGMVLEGGHYKHDAVNDALTRGEYQVYRFKRNKSGKPARLLVTDPNTRETKKYDVEAVDKSKRYTPKPRIKDVRRLVTGYRR